MLPVLCELGAHYSGDFANAAIKRLLKLCQGDIRRSVSGVFKDDETHWTNLIIDRAALLLPRLPITLN